MTIPSAKSHSWSPVNQPNQRRSQGYAMYLVGSEGVVTLWVVEIGSDDHRWPVPNTINTFEACHHRKTPGICDQTRGYNFSSRQRLAACCKNRKKYLENSGCEVLTHPPYSPDLAPSDFLWLCIRNWIDSFLAGKAQFFWDGIHKLPESYSFWRAILWIKYIVRFFYNKA